MEDKITNPFWTAVSDKKPPVNTAILVRGAHFVDSGLFFRQNFFFALRQVYMEDGVLSREQLHGVTHWAFIPPLAENIDQGNFNVCPTLKMEVMPLLNEG